MWLDEKLVMKNCTIVLWATLALFSGSSFAAQEKIPVYRGQNQSLIEWDQIDADRWLDFEAWKKARDLKDQYPNWETKVRERGHRALMGRVLDCVGDCRIYKGVDFIRAGFRNTVHQGDELVTEEGSYLWVYLLDGTLVRLSPDTSVTMKELNIGEQENLLHARLNAGNVLWLSRSEHKHVEKNIRETDALFLPLIYHQANPIKQEQKKLNEDNLFAVFEEDQTHLRQTQRLNSLIEENNKWVKGRPTYSFLVMPNGTVWGETVQAEFVVLLGGESFFKQRSLEDQKLTGDSDPPVLSFFFRGFENKDELYIKPSQWYKVEQRGRNFSEYDAPTLFGMSEFVTSRIPTIRVARELLLRRYSTFIYEDLSSAELAKEHGHRKWGTLESKTDDLARRLAFLMEHTRRTETSLLLTSSRFKQRVLEEKGQTLESMEYSARFFRKALAHYQRKKEVEQLYDLSGERLNSTKNPYWKIINARRTLRSP